MAYVVLAGHNNSRDGSCLCEKGVIKPGFRQKRGQPNAKQMLSR